MFKSLHTSILIILRSIRRQFLELRYGEVDSARLIEYLYCWSCRRVESLEGQAKFKVSLSLSCLRKPVLPCVRKPVLPCVRNTISLHPATRSERSRAQSSLNASPVAVCTFFSHFSAFHCNSNLRFFRDFGRPFLFFSSFVFNRHDRLSYFRANAFQSRSLYV